MKSTRKSLIYLEFALRLPSVNLAESENDDYDMLINSNTKA